MVFESFKGLIKFRRLTVIIPRDYISSKSCLAGYRREIGWINWVNDCLMPGIANLERVVEGRTDDPLPDSFSWKMNREVVA